MIIDHKNFVGKDLSNGTIGPHQYYACDFRHSNMSDALVYPGSMFNCDLTGALFIGTVIKLSCVQGNGNKADEMTLCLYLYWIIHFFDTPADFRNRIESIIGSRLPKIKKIFEMQCINLIDHAKETRT